MSRHLQECQTCAPSDSRRFLRRGLTRHKNRICAACRRYGPPDPFPNRFLARGA